MVLTDFLTGIANAIRSKDGTTEPIPANNFAQRIMDISVSSGGTELPDSIVIGTFTLAEDNKKITINHNSGIIPKAFVVFSDDKELGQLNSSLRAAILGYANNSNAGFEIQTWSSSNPVYLFSSTPSTTWSSESVTITTNGYFRSGIEYHWIAWKGDLE